MPVVEVVRAYRFALDFSPQQEAVAERTAGAARWAYNHAHAKMLAHYRAFAERRQRWVQERTGLDAEQILAQMSKAERTRLYREAGSAIKAQNAAAVGSLRVWDDHRRLVVHKGRPLLDPGPEPGPDAPPVEHDLYARRVRLAALQRQDPAGYAAAKKADLASVRPQVLKMKADLIAQGAYRPDAFTIASLWRTTRDLPADQGGSPWFGQVLAGAFPCGFSRADTAWRNWMSSAAGRRAGRRVGQPRWKKKGRCRDSFQLTNPGRTVIQVRDSRHLVVAGLGPVRLASSAKALLRLTRKGAADITSVTIARGGRRWYASVLCTVQQTVPTVWRHHLPAGVSVRDYPDSARDYLTPQAAESAQAVHGGVIEQIGHPTARQRAAGLLAIDLGSQPLAVLSGRLDQADPTSDRIAAAKPLHADRPRLLRAQRAYSRTRRGSKRRRAAARRLGHVHHLIAERRKSSLHHVSKALATGAHLLAVEGMDLTALTASARGTREAPGTDVAVKATFNRHLLDSGLGTLRAQLAYKTSWYGSVLITLDKTEPTASKCSKCGQRNPSSTPSHQRFTCPSCGLDIDRRTNAVRSIHRAARQAVPVSVAPGRGDTQNARREGNRPRAGNGARPPSLKRTPPA